MNRGRGFGRGRGRGGRGGGFSRGMDYGPPDEVIEFGTFLHPCEDDVIFRVILEDKVPKFNSALYLKDKTKFAKIDEIYGPIKNYEVSAKLEEGFQKASFEVGQMAYIDPNQLLPLQRFLPQPPGTKPQRGAGNRGGRGGNQRGRGFERGGGRGFQRGGRGGGGFQGGRGGFQGGRGGFQGGRGGFQGGRGGFQGGRGGFQNGRGGFQSGRGSGYQGGRCGSEGSFNRGNSMAGKRKHFDD
ncbi:GAR1 [Cordylochernes scorpioides]|uniref:H/ACA ribonucleoprotein complex subunit n=1 Tax=Cordylochernes scorpioides TaxID=51811 RepID=A0ABY6L8F6_9ARAC|nr:GAR1 [Cordylochernes scorpioides]